MFVLLFFNYASELLFLVNLTNLIYFPGTSLLYHTLTISIRFENDLENVRMFQNVLEKSKMSQKVLECPRRF